MHDDIRSTAEHYHQTTIYTPASIAAHPGLDWEGKPDLFKTYPGAESIELRDRLPIKPSQMYSFERPDLDAAEPISLEALSRALFATYGVTAIAQLPGETHLYRSAPSAGALYPSEIYLCVRDHPEIPGGVYNFLVSEHRLQRIAPQGLGLEGDQLFDHLKRACFGHPAFDQANLCIVLTSIFRRSTWRYRERGYRRCLLDAGHVIGNLEAYAPLEGYAVPAISGFVDDEVNDALNIDAVDEGALALFPLIPAAKARSDGQADKLFATSALRSNPLAEVQKESGDALVDAIHTSSCIQRSEAALVRTPPQVLRGPFDATSALRDRPTTELTMLPKALQDALFPTLLMRRSARRFRRDRSISLEKLQCVLEYAYRYDLVAAEAWEQPHFFARELLDTWVAVHAVDGVQPGSYHYSPGERKLRMIEAGDLRDACRYLSLQQDLAGDASAVVFHTTNLPRAVQLFGDRAYRLLHLDAGHLGERMTISAINEGLGMSGIAGFFDHEVNAMLGFPASEACVYISCLGVPERQG